MDDSSSPTIFEAKIKGIRFCLATRQEICKASISDCPISHASQLSNPFLGLPLETGKCESCGTGEAGQCEGHFGYIELPTPIYHPDHVGELKRMLSLLCLKCLKFRNRKSQVKNVTVAERMLSCCEDASLISINEAKTTDGAYYLELKVPPRSNLRQGFWNFLEKYGFRYGDMYSRIRPLLASEVMVILRRIPSGTRKKLVGKGYFPQDGYILQHLPVPPNCLSVPDVSDGISTMSTDYSIALLKKVLRQVEIIKNSRSGVPNFESHEIEANDLQAAVAQYLQFRGTGKASRDVDSRFGVNKEINASSTKAWLEKMKTLFIRKGSGFSSRSVITGDPFKGVSEIGLPFEVAQKITFEERVNQHNMQFLQKLVDDKLCLTYRDGMSTYSLREGSKGHTFLRPGQVVHRRIMDGDIVFINRPPTTHKHSLQALSVYIHDDHTVKINPLICGPLSADFDGDCIHLFYPQSLEAKAEVVELFSVDKQLLSSHTGNFNLQLATDSLLSLKVLFRNYFLDRAAAQQLSMHVPNVLPGPAVVKSNIGPLWTAPQILQTTLPLSFDYSGDNLKIAKSEVLFLDYNREVMAAIVNDIVTSLFFLKGPKEVLRFFNSTQPLLMESLYSKGFSVSLEDLFLTRDVLENIQLNIQNIYPLLCQLRASFSESIALQVDSYLRSVKIPVTNFIVKSSAIGHLIDSKSESALSKVVQQIGFLGIQISDKGKFYSETLVNDMSSLFQKKYPSYREYPTEEFGLVGRPLFRGLDPYQEMVHSISSREVIVRSSRGLTEPGTLFKNLMAILRDVVICHDGTVRNMCSNSIVQFEYGVSGANIASEFCAGDPVGVLAATAMSNPAYKAVLDSSPSCNSSWEMMKEILLSGVSFKNVTADRRVILYLNNCNCGRKHCQESAAFIVKNHLKKVSLRDTAMEFLIEYRSQMVHENPDVSPSLVGHIHLNKAQLVQSNISMRDILEKCQDTINCNQKKKKAGNLFKRIDLSFSECCSFYGSSKSKSIDVPCVQFLWQGPSNELLERASHILADTVCPVLLQTIIKGNPRVSTANIIWMTPETATWIRSQCKSPEGELALDITLEKEAVKQSGDAWRVVMDSCLPVIHLIDVQRSIPYAIKQVEDLLGISCAFDQAAQRLSTSVTMVTKGVLKDHLLLLGNSMTCAGTLIGFNAGGIKALSRSFGVQVPFMNATLFTPRKCFERAAEKCHVDNLSSIVGSCAWGKHVSVGTGSPFEILWDTRKAELTPDKEIDVYNFLYLVSGSSLRGDMGTACLGTEIEDLDQQDEYMDYDLSPVREDGMDKPTFEDGIEFGLHGNDNDGLSKEDANDSWSSWGKKVDAEENDWGKKAEQSSWSKKVDSEQNDGARNDGQSSWSTKVDSVEIDWGKKVEQSFWSKKVESEQNDWTMKDGQSSWTKKVDLEQNDKKKAEQSSWSKKVDSEENDWTVKDGPSSWRKNVDSAGNGWAKKTEQSSWSKKVASEENDVAKDAEENTWSKKFHSDDNHWKKKADQGTWDKKVDTKVNDWMQKSEQNTWSRKVNSEESDWMKKPEQSMWGEKVDSKKEDWTKHGERSSSAEEAKNNSSWGTDSDGGGWAKKDKKNKWSAMSSSTKPHGISDWASASGGKDGVENNDNSSWGNVSTPRTITQSSWGGVNTQNDSWGNASTPGNDTQSTWGGTKTVKDVFSGKPQEDGLSSSPSRSQWETAKYEQPKTPVWHTSGSAGDSKDNPWEAKVADQATESNPTPTWGSSNDWSKFDSECPAADDSWGSIQKQSTDSLAAQGWGSMKVDTSSESDVRPQWGRGRGRSRGRGRGRGGRSWEDSQGKGPSSDGDWKNRRPRPVDDPNAPAVFTITRQRLDLFTAEEQDVLSEIESIMKDIRRIMHQTGYNDGDPLSADDQTCITEKVFTYHPDKASKMGSGLAHIMVNRHKEFQESRCFYAVSVDGGETDFSYRKCLENFVRTKYPVKAESFIPKYFKKPQPRPNWNRDRCPPRSEAGTPRRTGDTPGPDSAGTPLWNKSEAGSWTCDTPGPDDATTPSWNKSEAGTSRWGTDQTPGPDNSTTGWNKNEGGASGWNADQTPATDDTGTSWGKSESQGLDGASMDWSKSETPGRNDAGTGWEKS